MIPQAVDIRVGKLADAWVEVTHDRAENAFDAIAVGVGIGALSDAVGAIVVAAHGMAEFVDQTGIGTVVQRSANIAAIADHRKPIGRVHGLTVEAVEPAQSTTDMVGHAERTQQSHQIRPVLVPPGAHVGQRWMGTVGEGIESIGVGGGFAITDLSVVNQAQRDVHLAVQVSLIGRRDQTVEVRLQASSVVSGQIRRVKQHHVDDGVAGGFW